MNAAFCRACVSSALMAAVACAGQVQLRDPNFLPAKLKGCAGYTPPSTATGTGIKLITVRVSFSIDARGDVVAGSVRAQPPESPLFTSTDKSGALAQAESDALSCHYDAALKSGVPVESGGFAVFSYEAREVEQRRMPQRME